MKVQNLLRSAGLGVVVAASAATFAGQARVEKPRTPAEKMSYAVERTEARTWTFWHFSQPYRFHAPAEAKPGMKYPLVVLMHGAGSRGTNNVSQIRVGGSDLFDWARRKGEEFFFLAPQCPEGRQWVDTPWGGRAHRMKKFPDRELEMAMDLVEDALWRHPVDPARVYVMGVSMGGYATWELVQRRPYWFAAAIPCCGGGDVTQADKIKDVPIWAFHGDEDSVVPTSRSRDMVRAIWALDGKVRYREYPGVGHNCWTPTFSDDTVFDWLFAQRKEPYPHPQNLPELLKTRTGASVTTRAQWEAARRPEIMETLASEVYGRRPAAADNPKSVRFVCESSVPALEGRATLKRIRVDYEGPYGKGAFPFCVFMPAGDRPVGTFLNLTTGRGVNPDAPRMRCWPVEEIVARGYATVGYDATKVAPDRDAGFKEGVFPVFERPEDRTDSSWATLSAWAWGASRIIDWIETEPRLDARRIAVVGLSRCGKTALWAGATDPRVACVCEMGSGCSGAKLNHVDLPLAERIEKILSVRQYWFCRNYAKYVGKDLTMDFDQHFLIAALAPRLAVVSSAAEDFWAGPVAEWWGAKCASPAWELYGLKGLTSDVWPQAGDADFGGSLGYHVRRGYHDILPIDWKRYMDFADLHGWADGTTVR